MALGHLAVERPGLILMLEEIACQIDNKDADGKPVMMWKFARMHAEAPFDVRIENEISRRLHLALQRFGKERVR